MKDYIYIKSTKAGKWLIAFSLLVSALFPGNIWAQESKKDVKFCAGVQALINSASSSSLGDNKGDAIGSDIFAAKTYLVSSDAKIYFDDAVSSNVMKSRY